jgi:hypothetical protein
MEPEIYLNDNETFKNLIQFLPHSKHYSPFRFPSQLLGVLYEIKKNDLCGQHVCLSGWL